MSSMTVRLDRRRRTLIGVAVVGNGNLDAFVSGGLRHFRQARGLGAVVSARPLGCEVPAQQF